MLRRVTTNQLRRILSRRRSAQMVTFVAETVPRMRMTDNPFRRNRDTKIARVNGVINWIYANSVNRQREREDKRPDFVPLERTWGERLRGLPFVAHVKDGVRRLYLEVKVQKSIYHEYRIDGVPATPEQEEIIEGFLYPHQESARQRLDNPVILRDYTLPNIKQIATGGELLVVE